MELFLFHLIQLQQAEGFHFVFCGSAVAEMPDAHNLN